MRLSEGCRLFTIPCGIRTKLPLGTRDPLYFYAIAMTRLITGNFENFYGLKSEKLIGSDVRKNIT